MRKPKPVRYEMRRARRAGARRHQEAGPDPRRRRLARPRPWLGQDRQAQHAAPSAPGRRAGLARLRLPAPRRRRPLPAGLLRDPRRRTQGDRRRVLGPRERVLRRRRHHHVTRDDRQRSLLPVTRCSPTRSATTIKHQRTRPYRPQTNGKVERFNRTLAAEWAYAEAYAPTSPAATYADWLHSYNHHRPHTGIGGLVPSDRVHNLTHWANLFLLIASAAGVVLVPAVRCGRWHLVPVGSSQRARRPREVRGRYASRRPRTRRLATRPGARSPSVGNEQSCPRSVGGAYLLVQQRGRTA